MKKICRNASDQKNQTEGVFHTGDNQSVFGAICDSAPDRWEKVLMHRAESKSAKSEKETARTLTEADYLLGVNDELRQGALRFSEKINLAIARFPKKDDEFAVEKWEVAKYFRLEKSEANKIIKEVAKAISKWREVAKNFDITKKEIDRMSSAFEHEDLEIAKTL